VEGWGGEICYDDDEGSIAERKELADGELRCKWMETSEIYDHTAMGWKGCGLA